LVPLTLDNLGDLSGHCRSCVFWELDPASAQQAAATGAAALEKEAWLSDTLLEWGSCGLLIYVDGEAAGHALYAPPAYVPRATAFPTSPVGADAVLMMTARVDPRFAGGGLGRMLMQGVARDVVRRGVRAIEAFGRSGGRRADHGPGSPPDLAPPSCLLPTDFLLSVGFKTVRPHPRTPRLRLEVRSLVSWREDVESAFERILGSMQVPSLSRS
jgi:GNAT superfamily N-acetyltransferase